MTIPCVQGDEKLSAFDDLFANNAVELSGHQPFEDSALGTSFRKAVRNRDRRSSIDPGGDKRVKRGRRRMSASETRNRTYELARSLPVVIAADRRLTPGDVRVLAVLVDAARYNSARITDISVPEIASTANLSVRQVQFTVKKLSKLPFNLVRRTYRKLRPGMNDTNVYQLSEACFADDREASEDEISQRPKERHSPKCSGRAARGEEKCGVKVSISDRYPATSTGSAGRRRSGGCRKDGPAEGSLRTRHSAPPVRIDGIARPRTALIPNFDPDDAGLIKRACAIIRPDLCPPDNPGEIVVFVDFLRRKYIPNFDEQAWPMLVARHGARAYLAVIEVLLMAGARAGTDRSINAFDRYLGGIVWKPKGRIDPAQSVAKLMANYGWFLGDMKLAGKGVPSALLDVPAPPSRSTIGGR